MAGWIWPRNRGGFLSSQLPASPQKSFLYNQMLFLKYFLYLVYWYPASIKLCVVLPSLSCFGSPEVDNVIVLRERKGRHKVIAVPWSSRLFREEDLTESRKILALKVSCDMWWLLGYHGAKLFSSMYSWPIKSFPTLQGQNSENKSFSKKSL